MDEEQKRVEQREQEMAAQEAEDTARHGRVAKTVILGLVLFLVVLLGWKLWGGKLSAPATALDTTAGPVCDAGTVDTETMMPAFIVREGAKLILYLACDGYPVGTTGEAVIRLEGQQILTVPFALEPLPIDENTSLFATDMGSLQPPGMYTVEFRTAGRQPRTLATTYTRVVAR